ncbi:MAG: xanthine dehydrogenase family protein molybdopterin-binding subunit, partial [Deltaproteobacteria bacterium]|nr:xanthine dehydrogenase family protein molybdopterin-binding subunit [Deltaproteobacteria bacterium]
MSIVKDEYEKMLQMQDNLGADKYQLNNFKNIGKQGIRRLDGIEKASGRARYTADIQLPGMLYMKFLTSPYPNARIESMDTTAAEKLEGVRAILRYDDPELPSSVDLGGHGPTAIRPLSNVARFEGEPVGAAVAADTESIAEEAVRLIKVRWSVRPFVLDVEEALDPSAPLANPEEFPDGNLEVEHIEGHGDLEKGFEEADRIIEFSARRRLHTYVSPERPCGVVRWNGEYPEFWQKHQRPHEAKRAIHSWFGGIPTNKIEMHFLYQGATFGGWTQFYWKQGPDYCAAVLAKRTGRPVKFMFSRREDFYGGSMDEGNYYFKVGFKNDGRITAVRAEAHFSNAQWEGFGPGTHFEDNTSIPNVEGRRKVIRINKGPNTAVRCEQLPNTLALTLVFDRVAAELGMDPIEVALKNDGAKGHDMVWVNEKKKELGFIPKDSLRECIEKGKEAIDWENKWHPPGTKRLPNGRMHGIAFTWTHEWDDSCGSGEIVMRLERDDGTLHILGQRCDNGVNADTTYCQIAADEIGMRIEDVFYNQHRDIPVYPMCPDSSTNMSVNGWAVRHCARLLKAKILEAATQPRAVTQRGSYPPFFPDCKPEDLDIKDSVIYVKKDPSRTLPISELVGASGEAGPLAFHELYGAERYPFSVPFLSYAYQVQIACYKGIRPKWCRQAHFMEIEVDIDTGEIFVTKVVNVNDVGKVISPETCAGQQYGGTYMGVGRALYEEIVHDPATGVMLNGNLLDYKIATMSDCGLIDTHLVETGQGYGPYGLVGIGEDIATVIPALLAPAVYNAIGKWIYDFPITPDKILKA